jgi:hypothetical protein
VACDDDRGAAASVGGGDGGGGYDDGDFGDETRHGTRPRPTK